MNTNSSSILSPMPRPSAFGRGFRTLRREPAVLAAEIGWRWLFGGIATALLLWATLSFLHAVDVSRSNQFLLGTLNPELMSYALRDMFHGKWWMFARLTAIVSISLSLLWIITATIARSVTTRVLVERAAEDYETERETAPNLGAIFGIQFVRIALLWIGLAAYFLSSLIAARLTVRGSETHTGAFLVLFLCMFSVAAIVLSFFNWILFLAPIFAIRDSLSFTSAPIEAWQFSRARAGSLFGLNLAHAGFRLVWLVFMSGVIFVPFGFARILPKSVVLLATVVLSLVYFAVADALFVARWAGFIEIAEQELHPEPEVPPQPFYQPPAPQETMPQDAEIEAATFEGAQIGADPEPFDVEPTSVPPETPGN